MIIEKGWKIEREREWPVENLSKLELGFRTDRDKLKVGDIKWKEETEALGSW